MPFEREDALKRRTEVASSFATKVYGWMGIGLGVTALIAYWVFASGLYKTLMPFWWICGVATLGIAFTISFKLERLTVPALMLLFLSYATVQGVFFGIALPGFAAAYGGGVIWSAFATAGALFFLAMGYGLMTRSDLTSIGRILTFGVIGLLGVTIVYALLSFFFNLTWLNLVISYVGLIIFVGLTAWDAQQIRSISRQVGGDGVLAYKIALVMALRMYVNVIMIFWYLLQIFSSSKR